MLEKIITGGQTGADQAAWRVAKAHGVACGGSMPKGFLTEDGVRPEFAGLYGATEMPTNRYADRTEQNVRDGDATLWFGETTTSGAQTTVGACQELGKACLPINPATRFEPSQVAAWIVENTVRTLNVAGNRESAEPGISQRVEGFLGQVLERLGHQRV
jgi:hypothetical protein